MQGEVLGDLNARRGRVRAPIRRQRPPGDRRPGPDRVVALRRRPARFTGGRGRFRTEHDHYDQKP